MSKVAAPEFQTFQAGSLEATPRWEDIAARLDPMMPATTYNAIRGQFFYSQIAPTLPEGISRSAEFQKFLQKTERPQLLREETTRVGLATAAFMKAALPGPRTEAIQQVMRKQGLRDGILANEADKTLAETVGSLGGLALGIEATTAAAGLLGPMVGLGGQIGQGLKAAKLSQRVLQGGVGFGIYSALEEQEGDRVLAGLEGAALGVLTELGMAGLGRMFGRSRQAAQAAIQASVEQRIFS